MVVGALVWLLKRAIAGPRRSGGAADEPRAAAQGELVSCAHCGVNLPKTEAHAAGGVLPDAGGVLPGAGGHYYCSEEHSRLGPRDG